jgi:N-acetylglutamate synthase-like GNAT family acetyltransferase
MIRQAVPEDIEWGLELLKIDGEPFSEEDARKSSLDLIVNHTVFVIEKQAFISGYVSEHWLDSSFKTFSIVLWKSKKPGAGLKLLRHTEAWCKEQGISRIILNTPPLEKFNFLQELGYPIYEVMRAKEL